MALGSREFLGYKDYQGTGFVVEGTAKYLESGSEFDMMKEKFSFLTRVLEIPPTSALAFSTPYSFTTAIPSSKSSLGDRITSSPA